MRIGMPSADTKPKRCIKQCCMSVMYRASCFSVYINQRDATLFMNDLYYPLFGSTCFGLSPVHHQEHHHLINCITHWYVRLDSSARTYQRVPQVWNHCIIGNRTKRAKWSAKPRTKFNGKSTGLVVTNYCLFFFVHFCCSLFQNCAA